MKKYLLIFSFFDSDSMLKKVFDGVKSRISVKNLKDFNIYCGIGMSFSIGKRNNKDSQLTKLHEKIRKNNFIENINKLQYSLGEINKNGISKDVKNFQISTREADLLWEYFSYIFHKVQVNEKDDFFIEYLLNTDFLHIFNIASKLENEKNNFIETLVNINFVENIFNINYDIKFYDSFSEIFYIYTLTNLPHMQSGLATSNNLSANNTENEYWYIVKNGEIKKEKSGQLTNASKIINNNNISFFKQLIPVSDENNIHFFILDEKGQIFHWLNHKNFEYETSTFKKVGSFDYKDTNISIDKTFVKKEEEKIKEEKIEEKREIKDLEKKHLSKENINKKKQEEESLIEKEKEEEKYEKNNEVLGSQLKLCKNTFKKNSKNSNSLTIMYLLELSENNSKSSRKILEKKQLEDFIKNLQDNKNLKLLNENSLNEVFYFLLGHHGKNIKFNNGFLPVNYIKYSGISKEKLDKLEETDKKLSENYYDLSNYEGLDNNKEYIKNAFSSLPITNQMTNQVIYANFLLCAINNNFIFLTMFNMIVNNKIQSDIKNKEEYSPYIINLQGGIRIFNNVYLTGVTELLLPNLYKYNKFCDFSVGVGLIINMLPFLLNIGLLFDIYNNTLNLKFSFNLLVEVFGTNTYENSNKPPYLEYI